MIQNENQIKSHLQRISNTLLINGGFLNNPGLYSGEMGLALFFAQYARFSQNELYSDYSFNLIEIIQKSIHKGTPVNYKNGLAGIGSSIEYLVQNDYFKVDTDFLLEEFDERIFSVENLPYLPIEDLLSIEYYALWRMSGNTARKQTILKTVLPQIVCFIEQKCQNLNNTYPTVGFFKKFISISLLKP